MNTPGTMSERAAYYLLYGRLVVALRRRRCLGQEALCAAVPKAVLTQPTLSRIERGEGAIGAFQARELARALGEEMPALLEAAWDRMQAMALELGGAGGPDARWRRIFEQIDTEGVRGLAAYCVALALGKQAGE